jgi:hypothetical protein
MIGASADNALSEDAMIGTGLIATPTANGRMSPIAWPTDLLFQL